MRTAIFFLAGLAGVALIGSFVPQAHTSAQTKVDQFLGSYPHLNSLLSAIGLPLTEVFVSPVFYALVASLFIALAACVFRRGRALVVRTLKPYRKTPQYWGEWGSWLFHTSFFLLVVAAIFGKATGFQGLATVVQGQTMTESRAAYDDLQEGVAFSGRHSNVQFALNKFNVTYADNGEPSDFVSNITVYDHGHAIKTQDVRVNEALNYDNVTLYQQDYGWAPHVVIKNPAGRTVFDEPVQLFGENRSFQTGDLKVPDFGYTLPGSSGAAQLGAKLVLYPDAQESPFVLPDGSVDPSQSTYAPGGFNPNNPILLAQVFLGDLGINQGVSQNVFTLDTTKMQPFPPDGAPVAMHLGDVLSVPLPAADGTTTNFTIGFTALPQYSLFMIKKDDGVGLIYAAFVMMVTGIVTKLYLRPLLERRSRRAAVRVQGVQPVPG